MIKNLHEKLKSKKISSVELTKAYFDRIEKDTNNVFITVSKKEALEQAEAADKKFKAGTADLLTGIPIAMKDIFCTKGIRTTCASNMLENYIPPYDATVIRRLKEKGVVLLGKTNLDEFAMGSSNENSAFGPVKNPRNPECVAGGSSGGSAAAIAAGLAVGSFGTDTGGSIRLPASYSGVVGMKPTYGNVSRFGMIAFASSLDQAGPFANTTDDCAALLSAVSGHDPNDSTSSSHQQEEWLQAFEASVDTKLTIGIPKEYFIDGIQKEVLEKVNAVKDALQKKGHKLVEISLPHTDYAIAVYYIVAISEASSNLSRYDGVRYGLRHKGDASLLDMYKHTRANFGEEVKRRILLGTFALSAGYYDAYYKKACQVRRLIKQDFDNAFKNVDVILSPVATTTAFKIGEKIADPLQMYLNDIFTVPASLAGLPGISVPCGRDAKGMPIGVQFIAPHLGEGTLFSMGRFVEQNVYREEFSDVL